MKKIAASELPGRLYPLGAGGVERSFDRGGVSGRAHAAGWWPSR